VTSFVLYRALLGFACQAPVFALFALERGAGYRDLTLWTLAFAAAKAACDVPAGAFADRFGRRPALLARAAIEAVSVAALFGHHFLFSSLLAGVACAFSSGAEAAFVYEHRPRDFARVFGRAASWSAISAAAAAAIGAALAVLDVRLVFALRLAVLLGAGAVAASLAEPERRPPAAPRAARASLPRLLAFAGLLGAVHVSALQLQAPFLREAGVPLAALGALYVAFQAATAVGARLAWRLPRALPSIALASAAGFAAMAAVAGLPGILGVFLLKAAHGMSIPIFGRALNERAPGGSRATSLSLRSLFEGAALLLAAPALGWAADALSLRAAFGLAATLIVPSLFLSEGVPCADSSGSPARA
jgi:MFS family permease